MLLTLMTLEESPALAHSSETVSYMSPPFFLLFWFQLRSDLERYAIKPTLGNDA